MGGPSGWARLDQGAGVPGLVNSRAVRQDGNYQDLGSTCSYGNPLVNIPATFCNLMGYTSADSPLENGGFAEHESVTH